MEDKELAEYLDQQRWLINNGLISDGVKNQLFFCGSIVHKDVQAVEVDIVPEERLIKYMLYFDKTTLDKVNKYHQLSKSTSAFGMWKFKRFLKKEGAMDFHGILNKFVRDYCGPKWSSVVTVKDFGTYIEELGEQGENHGGSQPPNQLPD
jgi:hypothetical protein